MVWAAAVRLIAYGANKNRRSADTVSGKAPAYWRTLGLITYPLYLTHNVIGAAMIHVLVDAGLDATSAVAISLGALVGVCWLICAKVEPVVRGALIQGISYVGSLPKTKALSRL